MTGHLFAACTLLVVVGCSKHDPTTSAGSASGSAYQTPLLREDMATVPGGSYVASDPIFAPDAAGTCAPETISKVRELAGREGWPDRAQTVATFLIDRDVVSCNEYEACASAGKCPVVEHSDLCHASGARVTVEQAVAYCSWRGAKLPTLLQWQAAVRGAAGKAEAVCDENLDKSKCIFHADSGVTIHPWRGASTEFTSTMGCWHDEHGTGGKLRRLNASPLPKQLYLFVPAGDNEYPETSWFRCARQPIAASNP